MPRVYIFVYTNSLKYFETVLAIKFVQGDDHKLNPLYKTVYRNGNQMQ